MNEKRLIDNFNRIVAANPLIVLPFGSIGKTLLVPAQRMFRFPLGAPIRVRCKRTALHLRLLLLLGELLLVEMLSYGFGLAAFEFQIILRHHIAQVPVNIHRFMIPDENVNLAFGSLSLLFQFHQQVHDLARVRTSVWNVAELDQMSLASRPVEFVVNYAGGFQQGYKGVVIAVNICDRHDSGDASPGVVGGMSRKRQRKDNPKDQNRAEIRSHNANTFL